MAASFWSQVALVVLGGLLTWGPTQWSEAKRFKREHGDRLREKAEETLEAISDSIQAAHKSMIWAAENLSDSHSAGVAPDAPTISKAAALVELYFPDCIGAIDNYRARETAISEEGVSLIKKPDGTLGSPDDIKGATFLMAHRRQEALKALDDAVREKFRQSVALSETKN